MQSFRLDASLQMEVQLHFGKVSDE